METSFYFGIRVDRTRYDDNGASRLRAVNATLGKHEAKTAEKYVEYLERYVLRRSEWQSLGGSTNLLSLLSFACRYLKLLLKGRKKETERERERENGNTVSERRGQAEKPINQCK